MNGQPTQAKELREFLPGLSRRLYNAAFRRKEVFVSAPVDNPFLLRFGLFKLDPQACELRKGETLLHLPPQPCKVLAMLASHPNKVFTREEIQHEIWGADTFVDFDQGLNAAVRQIRAALCDDAETPRYIETLPRRGYRFIGRITAPSPPSEFGKQGSGVAVESAEWPVAARGALRRLLWKFAAGLVLVGVAALLLWLNADKLRARIFATPRSIDIHSVAVLPFKNLSKDTEQEYFVDGMTDELITDLAKFGNLRVISHTSVERYKAGKRSLPEIARELGVDAVLEGSVMRSGDHVRVTAQLIRAANDEHIWAQSYDRNLVDALAVQGDIAQDIAKQIRVQATPEGRARKADLPLPSFEAQDAYMRGRYEWNKRTPQGLLRARAFFRQALDRNPNYALAWVGVADTEYLLSSFGYDMVPPREGMPRAKAAAKRALELDDGLGEAHASLALVTWAYDWNWPAAESEYKRALELNPSYASAHHFYGIGLASQGRFEESIAEQKHALELDPLSRIISVQLGRMLWYARRYNEAAVSLRKIVELEPDFFPGHEALGMVAVSAGHDDEALRQLRRARELAPDSTFALMNLARAYVRSGQRQPALAALQELRQIAKEKYVPAYQFAIVYAELGEANAAFQWLDKAVEEPSATDFGHANSSSTESPTEEYSA
jgi:TolB-like protein/DNA-binding winged helix-turn-helix (wHTH) protein/Tfp pilus assembly protein PilF